MQQRPWTELGYSITSSARIRIDPSEGRGTPTTVPFCQHRCRHGASHSLCSYRIFDRRPRRVLRTMKGPAVRPRSGIAMVKFTAVIVMRFANPRPMALMFSILHFSSSSSSDHRRPIRTSTNVHDWRLPRRLRYSATRAATPTVNGKASRNANGGSRVDPLSHTSPPWPPCSYPPSGRSFHLT